MVSVILITSISAFSLVTLVSPLNRISKAPEGGFGGRLYLSLFLSDSSSPKYNSKLLMLKVLAFSLRIELSGMVLTDTSLVNVISPFSDALIQYPFPGKISSDEI